MFLPPAPQTAQATWSLGLDHNRAGQNVPRRWYTEAHRIAQRLASRIFDTHPLRPKFDFDTSPQLEEVQ